MKRLLTVIIIVVVLFLGFQNRSALANLVYNSPCDTPKRYSIGAIDPRFNISQEEFLSATQEAANIWKNAEGKTLFVYDPEAKLKISLEYDERQYLNNQVDDLNTEIEEQKNTLKPEIADYERRAEAFKKRNADLNSRVDYWNNQGGAPEEEYRKLIDEQKALQQEAAQLQSMAEALNQSTDAYNTQIQELDQKVDAYNNTLAQKPEEGIYIREGRSEKIIIYFNNSRPELIHTLAHEMGHAINLPHVESADAIMYPKTTSTVQPSADDIEVLAEACRKRSIVETVGERFALVYDTVKEAVTNTIQKSNAH